MRNETITFNKYDALTIQLALRDCSEYYKKAIESSPILQHSLERESKKFEELAARIDVEIMGNGNPG